MENKSNMKCSEISKILGEKVKTTAVFLTECSPEQIPQAFKNLTEIAGRYCQWKVIISNIDEEEKESSCANIKNDAQKED